MNKLWLVGLVAAAGVGAGVMMTAKNQSTPTATPPKTAVAGPCREEAVTLENYGDKGKRLANCFVEYPGEPSREDKSYYVVEDICGQFTPEFVADLLGREVVKTEPPASAGLYNCSYYLNEKDNFLLNLEYLPIANQKKGNELAGRRAESVSRIPMENLVVWDENEAINVIYLVFNPNKFLSVRPVSVKTFRDNDEFLGFAAKLGEAVKTYK